jgi:cytochrome c553
MYGKSPMKAAMRGAATTLNDDQIASLSKYISSLK